MKLTTKETDALKQPKKKKQRKKRIDVSEGEQKELKKRKKRPSKDRERTPVSGEKKKRPANKKRKKSSSSQQPKIEQVSSKRGKARKVQRNKLNKKRKNNKINKTVTLLFDILFFTFIVFMLAGALIFTVSERNDKSFYGYRFYEVYTNSMRKTKADQKGNFTAGDMIIVKIEEPEKIKIGDIITFVPNQQAPDTYLTHRVIAKEEPKKSDPKVVDGTVQIAESYPVFTTQGDANSKSDPLVRGDRVIGVVKFAIPKAGSVLKFIRKNTIAVIIMVVSFFLLVILLRQYFVSEGEK